MKSLVTLTISTGVGCLLGVFLALGINSVLIQISINPFFNLYYGALFTSIGVMLLYRIG